jgi:hypothetical protein
MAVLAAQVQLETPMVVLAVELVHTVIILVVVPVEVTPVAELLITEMATLVAAAVLTTLEIYS